jgi:flagellar hook-basal body complex protein FliE
MDHILINTRFKNCIQNIKTVRGAECDSNHYLVKGNLKVKLKKLISRKGTLVDRYNVNKLKDTNISEIFKQQLHETMNILNKSQEKTINTKWNMIKTAIKTVTDTVKGKKREQRNRGSTTPARKHLIEGMKPKINCSTTPRQIRFIVCIFQI